MSRSRLRSLLPRLAAAYGPQGWWPLPLAADRPGFDGHGYHPGDYGAPRCAADRFAVAAGAVLTQNTAWRNAELALRALGEAGLMDARALAAAPVEEVAAAIRPSGYYNQKARKLQLLARFLDGRGDAPPGRHELLALWGIGPETADSILLYAYHVRVFVIDAYTRRLLGRLGLAAGRESYDDLAAMCAAATPGGEEAYNELHALIVRHAKEHCSSVPRCGRCPLARICPSRSPAR
jgi:endonuclease III related protein